MNLQVLSASGQKYVGLAKGKLEVMKAALAITQDSLLTKNFIVEGHTIYISTGVGGDRIRIAGGGGGNIFLTSDSKSGVFDWEKGAVVPASAVAGSSLPLVGLNPYRLFPASPDRIYTNEAQQVLSEKKVSLTKLPTDGLFPVYDPDTQKLFLTDLSNFYTVDEEGEIATLGNIPTAFKTIMTNIPITKSGQLIYIPTQYIDSEWNLFNPVEFAIFNPTNGVCFASFYWTPSYFYAPPANSMQMTPGYYYGQFGMDGWLLDVPNSTNYTPTPLSDALVVFGGLMESKDHSAVMKYGYCEVLARQNDEDVFYLTFFLSHTVFSEVGNPYFINLGAYEGTNKAGGTAFPGFAKTAFLNLKDTFPNANFDESIPVDGVSTANPLTPKISMWSCSSEIVDSFMAMDIDAFMVVVSVGNKAICYKYKGYFKTIWEGDNYHSHSSSYDGSIVSIFHCDPENPEKIGSISAFDTFPRGSTIELCTDTNVSSHGFLAGAVIPVLNEEYYKTTAPELPWKWSEIAPTQNQDDINYQEFFPPAGTVRFPDIHSGNASPVYINKMECSNGTHVTVKTYSDPCFESELQMFRAGSASESVTIQVGENSFTGPFSAAGGAVPGVLYQSVDDGSGTMPNEICFVKFIKGGGSRSSEVPVVGERMTVEPLPVSSSMGSFINTLSKNLTIARTVPFDTMEVISPTLGTVSYGGCFDSDGLEIPGCGFDEVTLSCGESGSDGYFRRFTAETSCGQSGEAEEELTKEEYEAVEMVLYQELDGEGNPIPISSVETGESAVVAGGVSPISWVVTGEASIEVENKGRLVSFYGGYCEGGRAVGTDACGMTVSVNIDSADGSYGWYYIGNVGLIESWPEDCSCGNSFGYRAAYDQSGGAHSDVYPDTRGVETHWGTYPIYDSGCSPNIRDGETIAGSGDSSDNCFISVGCSSNVAYCQEFPHDNDCYGLACS